MIRNKKTYNRKRTVNGVLKWRYGIILHLILMLSQLSANAQQLHCGTSEKMQQQLETDPGLAAARAAIQEFTEHWTAQHQAQAERTVYTIPVVVHVVYHTTNQNISDEQILSQMDVLNQDYRATNSDVSHVPGVWTSLVADCEIQFALAQRTPDGYGTNGITRTETDVTNWNGSDNVKYTSQGGHDAWPNNRYLNIWVCNIGSGLLGYAYQPGITPALDGLVIGYRYFGTVGNVSNSYDRGRTATHELGHYFNLDHPWGPGGSNTNCTASDMVDDTPVQKDPNFGCEIFPSLSCSNGPNGDMFMNYMDYSDDSCLVFFTEGQKARMLAALDGPRAGLKTSDGLTPPSGIAEHLLSGSLLVYPNPVSNTLNFRLDRPGTVTARIRLTDLSGKEILRETEHMLGQTARHIDISHVLPGVYILEIRTRHERISRRINIIR